MVQATSSGAGKSLITTALARAFARRGVDVAPFKAQNISNNARVVAGGEIGTAQYLQALAARVTPHVQMNPVLVKPEGDGRSQVVVLGRPDPEISELSWPERGPRLWPVIEACLHELVAAHELVLIEGAGSPAEINLRGSDVANMRTAKAACARVVVVADIDRGGAFAHLYGTWALLAPDERATIAGFVLNKFRGDPVLLEPAPERLRMLTGVATLGVMPWLSHGLPDEDGAATPSTTGNMTSVAIVRYPTASNLDEFKALQSAADIRWATTPGDVRAADLVVLPGSKDVVHDLGWLWTAGLANAVRARVRAGRPVLGICGGLQMLGSRLEDESGLGSRAGLGLLPLLTRLWPEKRTATTSVCFGELPAPWRALSHLSAKGYEIRHGRTTTIGPVTEALAGGLGYVDGPVLAVYLHGLLEDPELVAVLTGRRSDGSLDDVFDELADAIEACVDIEALLTRLGACTS
jgi:adenosylcobyric acid synthase